MLVVGCCWGLVVAVRCVMLAVVDVARCRFMFALVWFFGVRCALLVARVLLCAVCCVLVLFIFAVARCALLCVGC